MKPGRRALELSQYCRAFIKGIHQLHFLELEEKSDSPEADEIRDQLDEPWKQMSQGERSLASGLSADLFSISESKKTLGSVGPDIQMLIGAVVQAREVGEYENALELIRKGQAQFNPELSSYLRGTIWRDSGEYRTAALFFGHAAKLNPTNYLHRIFEMNAISKFSPSQASDIAVSMLRLHVDLDLEAISQAASVLFYGRRDDTSQWSSEKRRWLMDILNSTKTRISHGQFPNPPKRNSVVLLLSIMAGCYQETGDRSAARNCWDQAIALDPRNDTLLIARGTLLYGSDPQSVRDFQDAINLGSEIAWSYFFLAHRALTTADYRLCLQLCDSGLSLSHEGPLRAHFLDWKGISQAELGFPVTIVRQTFEEALRADPSNDRTLKNLKEYDRLASAPTEHLTASWIWESEAALRSSVRQDQMMLEAA